MLKSIRSCLPLFQHGFSMIELLVTILIFAIGFLGIASMQGMGMRLTYDAELMSQANLLVSSMANKIEGQGSLSGLSDWQQRVKDTLPKGRGEVKQSGHRYTLLVEWLGSEDSTQASQTRHYSMSIFL